MSNLGALCSPRMGMVKGWAILVGISSAIGGDDGGV
jgi:hypothetical protein